MGCFFSSQFNPHASLESTKVKGKRDIDKAIISDNTLDFGPNKNAQSLQTTKITNLAKEDQKIIAKLKQVKKQLEILQKQVNEFEEQSNFNPILKQHSGNKTLLINILRRKCTVKHTAQGGINFIGNFDIPSDQITKFKVRVIKITNRRLGIGIGTKCIFGTNNYRHKELLSFAYDQKCVHEYGVKRDLSNFNLMNGDVIELNVDRSANVVTSLINDSKIGQSAISEYFKNQKLYLIIWIQIKNDEFQLSW